MDDIRFERVAFSAPDPFVLRDHRPHAPARRVHLVADYYRPATDTAPFPGAVVSEGLGGVKTARERRYGRFLAQHGCATLVIDSFRARGRAGAIHPVRAIAVTESMMLSDAFAGLAWLADRAEVDSSRIFNVGFSYGGMIAVLAAYEQLRRHFLGADGPRFAGHVSYYGPTVPRLEDPTTTGAPVVIFNGARDDNLNRARLEAIVADLERGGSPVTSIVFPAARHQWDSNDHVERFDRFNLRPGAVTIRRDGTIVDERGGRRVEGFWSRLGMLWNSVSLRGFYLRRDEDVMRRTDAILLETIGVDGTATRHREVATAMQTDRAPR